MQKLPITQHSSVLSMATSMPTCSICMIKEVGLIHEDHPKVHAKPE